MFWLETLIHSQASGAFLVPAFVFPYARLVFAKLIIDRLWAIFPVENLAPTRFLLPLWYVNCRDRVSFTSVYRKKGGWAWIFYDS